MNDKGEYVQISIFDILENQEQKSYDRCDYCNMPCCYGCKYLEEDKDNGNS
jgi:hypothetical protein